MKNTAKNQKTSGDKFKEMIIYISDLSSNDGTFGMTKLNKLLFYSDFVHFAYHGSPISGEVYQKLPHGPAPRRLLPTLNEMQGNCDIVVREQIHHSFVQKKPIPLRDADLDVFTAREVDVIHSVISEFQELNAKQISNRSHRFIGWELAQEGETIPFEAALIGDREPTPGEIEYAKTLRDVARKALSKT